MPNPNVTSPVFCATLYICSVGCIGIVSSKLLISRMLYKTVSFQRRFNFYVSGITSKVHFTFVKSLCYITLHYIVGPIVEKCDPLYEKCTISRRTVSREIVHKDVGEFLTKFELLVFLAGGKHNV